jgi:hypothetical protein
MTNKHQWARTTASCFMIRVDLRFRWQARRFAALLKIARMREQVNPIQCQQRDDNSATESFLRVCNLGNSQAWRARDQDDQRISIKDQQCAERGENEWVPAQSGQKMAIQKLNRGSGRAASQARLASEIMKDAMRPWQTQCEPSRPRA